MSLPAAATTRAATLITVNEIFHSIQGESRHAGRPCVFVRFMEDNHLIDECWLAGEKERRKLAEDTHELFFRKHPHETDREYFHHVFHEIGKIPANWNRAFPVCSCPSSFQTK